MLKISEIAKVNPSKAENAVPLYAISRRMLVSIVAHKLIKIDIKKFKTLKIFEQYSLT